MDRIVLKDNLEISRLVHGHWRAVEWDLSNQEMISLIQQSIELGITTFDHADIYGDYSCEKIFGDALALKKEVRKDLQIVTKCGIKLLSSKYPDRKIKSYDYSAEYILSSVENSLTNFGTDYIDLLLLHRPAPFFDSVEVAETFSKLRKDGKVLHFGVSNFTPAQFEMLDSHLDFPLVTNQVEISPYCLEHFDNGNIDFFAKEGVSPMAWSPLGGGKILAPSDEKGQRILTVLTEIAKELGVDSIDKLIYSWLLKHPTGIIPILGTGKLERLKSATEAMNVEMTLEQWYQIFVASRGANVP